MQKSYRRKKSPSYGQKSNAGSSWKIILGIMIGLSIAIIYWQHQSSSNTALFNAHTSSHSALSAADATRNKIPKITQTTQTTTPTSAKPEFDFYTVLPKMQVQPAATEKDKPNTSTQNIATSKSQDTPPVTMTVPPTTAPIAISPQPSSMPLKIAPAPIASTDNLPKQGFALQVASVKSYADADNLKAQLTMLGFDVIIQKYTLNGESWNRVYAGFYRSREAAIKKQSILKENHIVSILVKTS